MSSRARGWLNLWMVGALGLGAFYIAVLWVAAHPNVSDAYRAYYIDRSSDEPVWLAEMQSGMLPPVSLGELYDHTANELFLLGWSHPEREHTWTLDNQAVIYFELPSDLEPGQGYEVVLRGFYFSGEQHIVITLDDRRIARTYSSGEEIVLPVVKAADEPKLQAVELQLPEASSSGTGDPRVLGFALQSFELRLAS